MIIGIYFGLYENNGEDNWQYINRTTYDYGTNINGGVYPWANIEINRNIYGQFDNKDNNEHCSSLVESNGDWNDKECSISKPFICNALSKICFE